MNHLAVRIRITGLVHGVFFRATMAQVALELGVSGWARNVADGTVEAFLEGPEVDVEKVVAWARLGPPRARVDSVKVQAAAPRNLRGFKIVG
jgi:acylphosphatase